MTTLVEQTARKLEALSLSGDSGRYLGNEDDLLVRFSVSRPTLRQAAKMVSSEKLIDVRRGSGGGFYASRPDASDAVRTLARYLRLRGARLGDVLTVNAAIGEMAAGLAAQNPDPELRQRLAAFGAAIDGNDTPATLVRAEGELARLMAEMSGNPVIEMVMAIGYSFGLDEQRVRFYADPADRKQARDLQQALVGAVLGGDAEVARLMMRRRSALVRSWVEQEQDRPD